MVLLIYIVSDLALKSCELTEHLLTAVYKCIFIQHVGDLGNISSNDNNRAMFRIENDRLKVSLKLTSITTAA